MYADFLIGDSFQRNYWRKNIDQLDYVLDKQLDPELSTQLRRSRVDQERFRSPLCQ